MKKILLLLILFVYSWNSYSTTNATKQQIINFYDKIDFGKNDTINSEVFIESMESFIPLDMYKRIVTIIDFSLPINKKRLWVIDLSKKKVIFNTYVSHGENSGKDIPNDFSNLENSHKSSCGRFITMKTYCSSSVGYALRIYGIDSIGKYKNYNVYDRGIVFHGAHYINKYSVGKSWGCFSLPKNESKEIIDYIKEGTFLYVYIKKEIDKCK